MNKNWASRAGIGSITAAAVVIGGIAIQANASGGAFDVYDEGDSPNPYNVTEGLVFYKGADLGWLVGAPIADVDSLAYTVADGSSYAPSYQLIVSSTQKSYARLVWEPYMQVDELDPNAGEYTHLEDGLWWTSKIADGPGSQSEPQPLAFFGNEGGAGWTNVMVGAVAVHQGTTTDATSVVTRVNYNGTDIPLGNADATPFTADDLDDAVTDAVADANADSAAALAAYTGTHHVADGTNIGTSRVVLAGAPVAGKKVGVDKYGTIGTKATGLKYQWYVSGHAVPGATKSTFTVPKSAKGHSVTVKVTGTYNYITFSVLSPVVKAQ